jgi:hypothetical protein
VHRGVGETKTDLNGQQAHLEKVEYDLHAEQSLIEPLSALLSWDVVQMQCTTGNWESQEEF